MKSGAVPDLAEPTLPGTVVELLCSHARQRGPPAPHVALRKILVPAREDQRPTTLPPPLSRVNAKISEALCATHCDWTALRPCTVINGRHLPTKNLPWVPQDVRPVMEDWVAGQAFRYHVLRALYEYHSVPLSMMACRCLLTCAQNKTLGSSC